MFLKRITQSRGSQKFINRYSKESNEGARSRRPERADKPKETGLSLDNLVGNEYFEGNRFKEIVAEIGKIGNITVEENARKINDEEIEVKFSREGKAYMAKISVKRNPNQTTFRVSVKIAPEHGRGKPVSKEYSERQSHAVPFAIVMAFHDAFVE